MRQAQRRPRPASLAGPGRQRRCLVGFPLRVRCWCRRRMVVPCRPGPRLPLPCFMHCFTGICSSTSGGLLFRQPAQQPVGRLAGLLGRGARHQPGPGRWRPRRAGAARCRQMARRAAAPSRPCSTLPQRSTLQNTGPKRMSIFLTDFSAGQARSAGWSGSISLKRYHYDCSLPRKLPSELQRWTRCHSSSAPGLWSSMPTRSCASCGCWASRRSYSAPTPAGKSRPTR